MAEPILDPLYWQKRLKQANHPHEAIFKTSLETWQAIERKHREILAKHITLADSILDVGCGWGRLLDLMPRWWGGTYLGLDISPDFIAMAHEMHPEGNFWMCDVRLIEERPGVRDTFDLAILISVRPMVKRNLGDEDWNLIERNVRRTCKKLLYLEYDEKDEGSLE